MTGLGHPAVRMECVMREENEGSTWASVVAVVTVVSTLGVLYLPLVIR